MCFASHTLSSLLSTAPTFSSLPSCSQSCRLNMGKVLIRKSLKCSRFSAFPLTNLMRGLDCAGFVLCMRVFKCNQQLIMLMKSLQLPTKCLLNRYQIVRVEIFNRQTLASSSSPLKNNTKMNQYLKQGQCCRHVEHFESRVWLPKKVTEISARTRYIWIFHWLCTRIFSGWFWSKRK